MAIFLITGNACEARDLAKDLSPRQVLQGHDDVRELITWLKEARKLSTGLCHWSVIHLSQDDVLKVYAAFPPGEVRHFHCGTRDAACPNADWYFKEGDRLG